MLEDLYDRFHAVPLWEGEGRSFRLTGRFDIIDSAAPWPERVVLDDIEDHATALLALGDVIAAEFWHQSNTAASAAAELHQLGLAVKADLTPNSNGGPTDDA